MIKNFVINLIKWFPKLSFMLLLLKNGKVIELTEKTSTATIRERFYCAIARYAGSGCKKPIMRTIYYKSEEFLFKLRLDITEFTQCSYYFRYSNIDLLDIFYKNELYRGKVLIDVGSNVGSVSIIGSKFFKNVIAFEPFTPSFQRFKENIEINKISNIEPINLALSNQNSEVSMYINPLNTGGNSLIDNFKNKFLIDSENIEMIEVRATKLDTYFEGLQDLNIGFIKIDVEGLEEKVLMGAIETIKRNRPDIYLEIGCDRKRFGEICKLLDGYTPFNPNGMTEITESENIPFDVLFRIIN